MGKIIFILIVLLFSSLMEATDLDRYVNDYLSGLEKKGTSIFITKCISKKDHNYIEILLIRSDSVEGLLIEMRKNTVVNVASVITTSSGLKLGETEGGTYTYDRVSLLIAELAKKSFRLLSPIHLSDYKKIKPAETCIYSP